MISLKIEDVKSFMSMLLTNSLFDEFILKEMEIQTFTNFKVSGQFYKDFFSQEEIEDRMRKLLYYGARLEGLHFLLSVVTKPHYQ